MEQLRADLWLAWRGLRRARGFAAAAVLTLAAGIGGATAMFAIVHGVLLRPLPVRDQERLVVIQKQAPASPATRWPFHANEIAEIGRSSRVLEAVAGIGYQAPSRVIAIENGAADYVHVTRVTGDFFDVLGVGPVLGRRLGRPDDRDGAERVMVISHALWQRRYGGARDALGRRLVINEQPFTIVGVMPPGVEYPRGTAAWATAAAIASAAANSTFREAALTEFVAVARTRPGVTLEQVAGELRALAPVLETVAPASSTPGLVPLVRTYEDAVVGDVRAALLAPFAAVALVLVVAGTNVANLLVMRGEERRAELAVRAALGATRARLVRQVVAESLVLAGAASACGLLAAWWILPGLVAIVPDGLPRADAVRVDARVVLFTVVVAGISAVLVGLAPALASTAAPVTELRGAGGTATAALARRGRRTLVVVQVALAVVVVAAAALLARGLLQLRSLAMDLGTDCLVLVPLAMPQDEYADRERRLQFLTAAIEQLESLPMVAAATPVNAVPFTGVGWGVPAFTAEGQSREEAADNPSLNFEAIHPNYFDVFAVPIVRGRPFTAADSDGATPVAIVSEDVAVRTWPGADPLGKRIRIGAIDSDAPWLEVVGVAAPTRYRELAEPRATLYVPAEQLIVTADTFVIRTAASPAALLPLVRERLRAVDPAVAVVRAAPFRELLERPLARPRFNALLTVAFGAAALFLAAIGLYAVMAAYVRARQREIGIRMAIGARASDVRALVLGEGLRLAGLGALAGVALATGGNRLLRGVLADMTPLAPALPVAAAVLLLGVSAVACYLPARRATRVDPIAILRAE